LCGQHPCLGGVSIMPQLDIDIIFRSNETLKADAVQRLADAAGKVFDTPPGKTWVKINPVPRNYWAENKVTLDSYVGPVIVNILKRRVPPPDLIEVEVTELTRTIAGILDRPHEHVHLKYESDAIGRVAYGGKLVN
jgi:phenylpyruvate tautomerase PptA (4-oxalocrotonate tautomerase family)